MGDIVCLFVGFFGWKGKSHRAWVWGTGRSLTNTSRNAITWQSNSIRERTSNRMHGASQSFKKLLPKSSSSGSGWGFTFPSPKYVSPSSMQDWSTLFLQKSHKVLILLHKLTGWASPGFCSAGCRGRLLQSSSLLPTLVGTFGSGFWSGKGRWTWR